jgi:hypothetical protein
VAINPLVVNSKLLVDVGSAQETVTITAVHCSNPSLNSVTGGICTVTGSFSNAHSATYQITSGSYGLQEALDYLTNTGGQGQVVVPPYFAGSTSNITGALRGATTIAIVDMRNGSATRYGWNGSAYASVQSVGAANVNLTGSSASGANLLVQGIPTYVEATADTSTAGASFTAATGLTWTIPVTTAINYPFHCELTWTQATAATANAFGIQTATNAPTAGALNGLATTGNTAVVRAAVTGYNTASAQTIVTATPGAAAQTDSVVLDGFIEQPSSSGTSVVSIGVATTSGGTDITTIKRGSYCRLF